MKKFLLIVPIVGLLAAGCNSSTTTQPTTDQTQPTQSATQNPAPSPTTDSQTSNGKVYTNSTYGFQLTYPSDWNTREYGQKDNYFIIFSNFSALAPSTPANNFEIQVRDLTTVDNGKDLQDLKSELASTGNTVNGVSAAHITVGGVPAIRLIHLDPSPVLREDNIEFLNGNTEFNIAEQSQGSSSASVAEQQIQQMDTILATFKFTN